MSEYVGKAIVGTWELISWNIVDEDKNEAPFFEEELQGILMYDSNGFMNAQIAMDNRPDFKDDSILNGKKKEKIHAYSSYFAYYGRYFERDAGEIVHLVHGSLFPNWVGKEEIRYAKIKGEFLYLRTLPIKMKNKIFFFKVKWKKVT